MSHRDLSISFDRLTRTQSMLLKQPKTSVKEVKWLKSPDLHYIRHAFYWLNAKHIQYKQELKTTTV